MATGKRVRQPHASIWLAEKPTVRRQSAAGRGKGRSEGQAEQAEQATGLDLDKIVAATVRLLDTEGLAKFSMRRLAAELGVTAMSVYWYVATKDDLLELALDAVHGPMPLPDPEDESADWRDQLRGLAHEYRKLLTGHLWVPQLLGLFINIGPRSMDFSNCTLRVIGRSGLPVEEQAGALSSVFQFVYGFATVEALYNARCQAAGYSPDEFLSDMVGAVRGRPRFQESLEAFDVMQEARGSSSVVEMRDHDFRFALDILIAGIEAMRERPRPPAREVAGAGPDAARSG
ncbi:TetR/AcrR family transcriptional regulator [Streptomyces palmae]|uniref:TetR/AcrR family transcriptional regulator n=1 Tax=Streptomyces palmae TaxID=1701085 RepID=A0A4Z0GK80_9ACTN|nr:TetR/AcrR family transcriptional regulator [Streptomyces palmae]TGA96369.1 TetR/AcrR family transcriptional regulator [Streptomyces palmae]